MIKAPKKLIETIIPLDAINAASAREKSIRHGHPSTLHLWWARRPLAAARAVIFAQMVNDPLEKYGDNPTPQQRAAATKKRNELHQIIKDLVVWENSNNREVLDRARAAIRESWEETCALNHYAEGFDPKRLPAFHDPFAGGGAIPLEAQRLGLESWASDLNPVPVMINKAMIEIPPKFAGRQPIGPLPPDEQEDLPVGSALRADRNRWPGATGLAEDVRRYGLWMREEAKKRIGHLYPDAEITPEMAADRPDLKPYVGRKLTVIAWLWARTVKSPDPRFSSIDVPLVSSFVLSTKKGKEAWVEPVVSDDGYRFEVRRSEAPASAVSGTKAKAKGADFECLLSHTPIQAGYIRKEALEQRMGAKLMAIVCAGDRERVYLSPLAQHESAACTVEPTWFPDVAFCKDALGFRIGNYGMSKWSDLYTKRQLAVLSTLSSLVKEIRDRIEEDYLSQLGSDGEHAKSYSDAVALYLAFAVDKVANRSSTMCTFKSTVQCPGDAFGRQALPMTWDYAESNVLFGPSGSFESMCENVVAGMLSTEVEETFVGHAVQCDAQQQDVSRMKVVSTDPPYYDNIGYADLSDYFYVWLRNSIGEVYPEVFATLSTPKDSELVATPCRHGGNDAAAEFFLSGMITTFHRIAALAHPAFPVTIYYAFKQNDTDDGKTGNTGWETFLEAVVRAGFMLTGTWPMDTERANRKRAQDSNALASSLVLVCRKRPKDAAEIEKREFLAELREEMPKALATMQGLEGDIAPIAPVDLAQAAIGPGMKIYSKYAKVLNSDGSRMSVHDAIVEINRFLGSGDFDKATNVCLKLFETHGWSDMPYADAEGFCLAQGTSVGHIVDSSVLKAGGGRAQLVHWQDYPRDYDPKKDRNRPTWEATHHLVRALQQEGEAGAGALLARMPEAAEQIRALAYALYTLCERRGFAEDARAYNALITSWSQVQIEQMKYAATHGAEQMEMF